MFPHLAMRVGSPYERAYVWARMSVIAFEASYGSEPASGSVSTYGSFSLRPYALSLDATATMGGSSSPRHASRSDQVPRMLVSNVPVGSPRAAPTSAWAPRWKT